MAFDWNLLSQRMSKSPRRLFGLLPRWIGYAAGNLFGTTPSDATTTFRFSLRITS
jgi:hypothetical protein